MLRILGAVAVIVSGAYVAHMLNESAKRRLKQTEAFISLVRFIRSQRECFAMPLTLTLVRCPRDILKRCGYSLSEPPPSGESLMSGCGIEDVGTGECMDE